MLPGFRFLFAATLLTLSLVVFGLGAAALLRASHERFASLPNRPVPAPPLTTVADATPTLSMLRIETPETREPLVAAETVVAHLPVDTLLPTDKVASLSIAPRVEETVLPPVAAEVKADIKPDPPAIDVKAEMSAPTAELVAPPVEVVAQIAMPAPPEPVVIAKIDEAATVETPASPPQQIAALVEPDITGSTRTPEAVVEPPLANAKPIRKPPIPADRPAAADVVAALPDPAVTATATADESAKPSIRKRKPVVKRVAKPKRRVVARPAPQRPTAAPNPASPFGATGFGTPGLRT